MKESTVSKKHNVSFESLGKTFDIFEEAQVTKAWKNFENGQYIFTCITELIRKKSNFRECWYNQMPNGLMVLELNKRTVPAYLERPAEVGFYIEEPHKMVLRRIIMSTNLELKEVWLAEDRLLQHGVTR